MVVIQLLLSMGGAASADRLAPLAEMRRGGHAGRAFRQESIHLRTLPVELLDEGNR
jgi:hypothetical protein